MKNFRDLAAPCAFASLIYSWCRLLDYSDGVVVLHRMDNLPVQKIMGSTEM